MIPSLAILARSPLALACALAFAVGGAVTAHGQSSPNRSIKLVVPFGPGGPTDVSARIVAQVMQSALGQSVVIENRPGAGGALGSKSVANADPDGATLLIGTSATLGVVPALVKNPGYDPIKSFAPVAKVADSTLALVVPANFPANSVDEFVAYAKANPGKLSYASAGVGNQTQLLAELFKSKAGIDVVHVPYKSGAEMVTAISERAGADGLSGRVDSDPAHPRGKAQGARRHQREAASPAAGDSDHDRKRHPRLHHDVLVGRRRAIGHAGGHGRPAQCRDQ